MYVATQFSVFVVNRPGVLAAVTGALAKAGVNMTALSLMDSGDHGMLRLVCTDPAKARAVLVETHDRWTETQVLVLELDNTPGAFAAACQRLAANEINVTYAYATSGPSQSTASVIFKIDDVERARKLLENGV